MPLENVSASDLKSFIDRISIDLVTECWNWLGAIQSKGYGMVMWAGDWMLAHRASFKIYKGEPLYQILHRCDNRKCVNPEHLYDGTPAQNTLDMLTRGREFRKYSNKVHDEIITAKLEGATYKELKSRFGISKTHLHRLVNRRKERVAISQT